MFLQILFVEDSEDDVALVLRVLKRSGYEIQSERVETAKGMQTALLDKQWDIIICDYTMPSFNALQALEVLKASGRDLPFIVVSGTIGEETAVTVLKAGAQDFMVKDHLDRLGPAIQRELQEADTRYKRKQAEEKLATSEAELRTLFSSMTDAVIVLDADGRYVKIAPTNPINLYRPPDEMLGKTVHEILPKQQADYIVAKTRAAIQTDKVVPAEYALQFGVKEVWFSCNVTRLSENTALWVAHDFTEYKKAEGTIRQHIAKLEMLYKSGLALGQLLSPKMIAQKIVDVMKAQLDWHHIAIRLYHPEDESLELLAFNQPGASGTAELREAEQRLKSMISKAGKGLSGWAVQHRQNVRVGNLPQDPRYVEVLPSLHSGLYIPLMVEDRVVGVISIESEKPEAFSDIDEQLVITLANQAASGLENARLYEETLRQLKQLQALHTIDRAIAGSFDQSMMLDVLLTQTLSQLEADAAAIFLIQPHQRGALQYVAGQGFNTALIEIASMKLGNSLAGEAVAKREMINIREPKEREQDPLLSKLWSEEGFKGMHVIPLISKGEVKGVMAVFHRKGFTPNLAWSSFLETLAGQAAIAIDVTQMFDNLQRANMELAVAYEATIEGWSQAMDLRDKETEGHTQRVTQMSLRLGKTMQLGEESLLHMRRGALLHDIGKLGVPDHILLKPDKLTDDEWAIMRKHPEFAYDMLHSVAYLRESMDIPYCHHEKWDGSGYPQGLKGEQIPLAARIFAVVDVWDALTSDRPYRKAWSKPDALKYIHEQSGQHFEPKVVEVFMKEFGNE
jgi:response regulator RpfG family c-di-GMP phosphodiesterase